jgi:hypothetical protein
MNQIDEAMRNICFLNPLEQVVVDDDGDIFNHIVLAYSFD